MPPLTITITNCLQLKNVPLEILETLTGKLAFVNPKWLENERLGRWNRGTPKLLKYYDKVGKTGLWIPRGYMRQLILLCRREGLDYQIDDRRNERPPLSCLIGCWESSGYGHPQADRAARNALRPSGVPGR